jgi:arylsulfatase A-like enzyme
MPSTFQLALMAAALLGACSDPAPSGRRPNILLVTLDTTRPDHLGCYGAAAGITPNIDALAQSSTLFDRVISTAGITPMAHASILTGLNNYKHGMRTFYSEQCGHTLKDSVETLPETLQRNGYRTAAVVSAYVVSEIYNLHQGFDTFLSGVDLDAIDITHQQKHATEWDTTGLTNTQRRSDFTITDALQWLEESEDDPRPWFLWVHLFDVHDFSLVPPTEFIESYGITYPPLGTKFKGMRSHEWREKMYDPELTYMDKQLGRLLDHLHHSGEFDNTLIAITADHGQGLLDGYRRHQWAKHRLLYDWCIRVPLVLHLPGERERERVPDQVRTIDITPTILHFLDIAPGQELDGLSLLPLMRGGSESEPRLAYADALNLYDAHSPARKSLPSGHYDNLYAVCDGRWKLVWREEHPENSELFDLASDPLELNNLYRVDHPEGMRLLAQLDAWEATKVTPPEGGVEASAQALKSLGYMGDDEEEVVEDGAPREADSRR